MSLGRLIFKAVFRAAKYGLLGALLLVSLILIKGHITHDDQVGWVGLAVPFYFMFFFVGSFIVQFWKLERIQNPELKKGQKYLVYGISMALFGYMLLFFLF